MASRPHKGPGHVPQCDPRGISSRVFTQETAVAKYKKDSDTDANSKKKPKVKKADARSKQGPSGVGGKENGSTMRSGVPLFRWAGTGAS